MMSNGKFIVDNQDKKARQCPFVVGSVLAKTPIIRPIMQFFVNRTGHAFFLRKLEE
jgi:hypothetical protein